MTAPTFTDPGHQSLFERLAARLVDHGVAHARAVALAREAVSRHYGLPAANGEAVRVSARPRERVLRVSNGLR